MVLLHNQNDERRSNEPMSIEQTTNTKLLWECNKITEEYKGGKLTKARALASIYAKLSETIGEDRPRELENTFESHVDIIDSIGAQEKAAEKRGRSRSISPYDGTQADSPQSPDKRARLSSVPHGTRTLDVDESTTPWSSAAATGRLFTARALSPSLRKTNDLIRLYTSNIKGYRRSLLNSDACPEFPDSEWTNVLTGRVVNLDVVYGARFTTSNDNRRTEVFVSISINQLLTQERRSERIKMNLGIRRVG
jgi:hypothetical protein